MRPGQIPRDFPRDAPLRDHARLHGAARAGEQGPVLRLVRKHPAPARPVLRGHRGPPGGVPVAVLLPRRLLASHGGHPGRASLANRTLIFPPRTERGADCPRPSLALTQTQAIRTASSLAERTRSARAGPSPAATRPSSSSLCGTPFSTPSASKRACTRRPARRPRTTTLASRRVRS